MSWSLEIGVYPGILFGVRTYEYDNGDRDWCLYIPMVILLFKTFEDEGIEFTPDEEQD